MVQLSFYNEGVYNFFVYNLAPSSGTGVVLDGKRKYLATTAEAPLNFANAWSISVWAKPEPGDEFRTLFCVENRYRQSRIKLSTAPVSDETNLLFDRPTDLRVEMTDEDGTLIQNYGWESFFRDQTWTHVGVTWDGASLVSYVDGVSGTTSVVLTNSGGVLSDVPRNVFYGFGMTGGVANWSGTVGPAAIWDSVLGPEEWPTVASGQFEFDPTTTTGTYSSQANLVQFWPLQNQGDISENLAVSGVRLDRLRNISEDDFTFDIPGNELPE